VSDKGQSQQERTRWGQTRGHYRGEMCRYATW